MKLKDTDLILDYLKRGCRLWHSEGLVGSRDKYWLSSEGTKFSRHIHISINTYTARAMLKKNDFINLPDEVKKNHFGGLAHIYKLKGFK